jgi:hypothetical protein
MTWENKAERMTKTFIWKRVFGGKDTGCQLGRSTGMWGICQWIDELVGMTNKDYLS